MKKGMHVLVLIATSSIAWAQEKFDSDKFYSGDALLTTVCDYRSLITFARPWSPSINTFIHFDKFYQAPCHHYFLPRSGIAENSKFEKSYLQKDMMKVITRYCIIDYMKKQLRENRGALACVQRFDKKYFSPEAIKQCENRNTKLEECLDLAKSFSHLEVEEKAINSGSRIIDTKKVPTDPTSSGDNKGLRK